MFKANDLVYIRHITKETLNMSSGGSEAEKIKASHEKSLCKIHSVSPPGPYIKRIADNKTLGYVAPCDLKYAKQKPTVILSED